MVRKLVAALVAVAALAGCGSEDPEPSAETRAGGGGRPGRDQGLPARAHGDPATAHCGTGGRRRGLSRGGRGDGLRLPAPARSAARGGRGAGRAHAGDVPQGQSRLRGDGGRRGGRAVAGRLRRDHRRRRRQVRPGERRAVLDPHARRQDLRAARQLLLPARDLAVGHRAAVRGAGRGARPRRRRQGRLRRGAARRRLPRGGRARLRRQCLRARRRGARVAADAAGRVHRAGGDDAHDVRVLRGVEELALRGRRRRRGELVRRRLAAPGHRRHPRRPRPDLRQRAPRGRRDRLRSRHARPAASSRTSSRSPPGCATRRPSGRRFTAREADTLGSEAQDRAEAIAGQVSQAAGRLGITLEN